MSYKAWFLGIVLLLAMPNAAFAIVEVFSATASGTSSCGDFNTVKFKQAIFVSFDGSDIVLAGDIGFTNILAELSIFRTYDISATSGAFSASESDVSTLVVLTGTAKGGPGGIASFSATFNQLIINGCFENGTIKSGKRLF